MGTSVIASPRLLRLSKNIRDFLRFFLKNSNSYKFLRILEEIILRLLGTW